MAANEPDSAVRFTVMSTVQGHLAQYIREDLGNSIRPTRKKDWGEESQEATAKDQRQLCQLVRCIFGSPFHVVRVDPAWLTWNGGTVVTIAQGFYEAPSVATLGVLADALEEAGCTEETILSHCRDRGLHAKGCWVVDQLLGKS
jgi:hypothetical protein